jgi:hypothetical protein
VARILLSPEDRAAISGDPSRRGRGMEPRRQSMATGRRARAGRRGGQPGPRPAGEPVWEQSRRPAGAWTSLSLFFSICGGVPRKHGYPVLSSAS